MIVSSSGKGKEGAYSLKMKVILKQTVPKLGKEGQVVDVSDGYARNFLFPRGLAVLATPGALKQLERKIAKSAALAAQTKESAKKLAESLGGRTLRLVRKTAPGSTKLFGAVTAEHIAEGIKEQLGVEVDRKHVALLHPIKRLGVYEILLDLHREVEATVRLEVADEFGNLGIEIPREVSEELKEILGEGEPLTEELSPPSTPEEEPQPRKRERRRKHPS